MGVALFDDPCTQPNSMISLKSKPKASPNQNPKKANANLPSNNAYKDSQTVWHTITIAWYGGVIRTLEITSGTALWYSQGQDPLPIRWVLVRDPLGKLKPSAFLCTDLKVSVQQILAWYVMRWNIEVTFEDARAHLGLETQRQWNDLAIARTTPALFGMYSLIVLIAYRLLKGQALPIHHTAWYTKPEATFSDVIAFVRQHLWENTEFLHSHNLGRPVPIPEHVLHTLIDILCYAA